MSAGLRAGDRWLAKRLAAWDPVRVGKPFWAVEETVERARLWCAAAVGWPGEAVGAAGERRRWAWQR